MQFSLIGYGKIHWFHRKGMPHQIAFEWITPTIDLLHILVCEIKTEQKIVVNGNKVLRWKQLDVLFVKKEWGLNYKHDMYKKKFLSHTEADKTRFQLRYENLEKTWRKLFIFPNEVKNL